MTGSVEAWRTRYSASLMNTFGPPKLVLERGAGAHVWDTDGREYLDLLGGIAVNSLGHSHPALVAAVTGQLQQLGHISNFFTSPAQVALAERLLDLTGRDGRVFFTNSGSEANEAALKVTRRIGRSHLVATEGAFHGRTLGALALTAKENYRRPFEPLPGDVTFVPYGDADALAAAVTDRTAAVVLEPIQGEAGVVIPPDGYLGAARAITRDHHALLWLDEVQTGIGRTGQWFAHEPAVQPDLVTVAKGLGGGLPVGACLAFGDAARLLGPGDHGTTFGGNPVACAAGLAVIETIEKDGLLAAAQERGDQLREGLAADDRVLAVRQAGLLIGLDLDRPVAAEVVAAAQAEGFLINAPTPRRIRLAPPLVLTADDAAAFAEAWPRILDRADDILEPTT